MKTAIYSCILGKYENLNELSPSVTGDCEAIMFTDDRELKSSSWRVVHVDPAFPEDPVRSQRQIKILGHPELGGYDNLLYVDNTVKLLTPGNVIIENWLKHGSVAMPVHSFRSTVLEELEVVIRSKLDDPERLEEQREHYLELYPEAMNTRPLWTGMIARKNDDEYLYFARLWMDHVLRYSRRDQLSVRVAERLAGLKIREIRVNNHESGWHQWPVVKNRRHDIRVKSPLQHRHEYPDAVQELEHMRRSLSWRVTKPLRALRRMFGP